MTFIKAGTKDMPMEGVAMKQLSRENSLIGMAKKTSKERFDTFTHVLTDPRGRPHDSVTRRPSDQYWAGYQLEQYDVLAPRRAHWSSKC
jgi:hypothetical protein